MKQSICQYSLHRRFTQEAWTLGQMTDEVRKLGVSAVDFHASYVGPIADAAKRMKAAISKSGLALSGFSLGNNFNKETDEEFRAEVEKSKDWIRIAAEIQAPVSRIFGGSISAAARRDAQVRAVGRERVIRGLAAILPEAEKCGMILAIENHGGLPCTGEEQVAVIKEFGSPFLRATVDVGNYMGCGQEGHIGTRMAAPYAAYVHFKDFEKIEDETSPWGWKTRACVVGSGIVNHRVCLEALRDAGYDGYIALEYEGPEDETTGVPKSVEFMKRVMASF